MAQPTPYNKNRNFADWQSSNPNTVHEGSALDAEFDDIEQTLDEALANLGLIQRDDGALRNSSVHPDSLSTATKALIGAGGTDNLNWTPQGLWVTATAYVVGDLVEKDGIAYVAAEDHTSGTFATDHTAGKWIAFAEVSPGSLQQAEETFAAAAGTVDVITATFTPTITALTDGMLLRVRAAGANATTTPTLNVNGLGAKTIVKLGNQALVAGDIFGAKHILLLVYREADDVFELLNPGVTAFAQTLLDDADADAFVKTLVDGATAESSLAFNDLLLFSDVSAGDGRKATYSNIAKLLNPFGFPINLRIVPSVDSNALTVAFKGKDGNDPSTSNEVIFYTRSSTASSGAYTERSLTSAASVVVPSGATLGHADGKKEYIYVYGIDNSGTIEAAVSTKFFGWHGIVSTTAISTSADSSTVMYSTTARSDVPYACVGMLEVTEATAGTWATAPSAVHPVPFSHTFEIQHFFTTDTDSGNNRNWAIRQGSDRDTNKNALAILASNAEGGDPLTDGTEFFTIDRNGNLFVGTGLDGDAVAYADRQIIVRTSSDTGTRAKVRVARGTDTAFGDFYWLVSDDTLRIGVQNNDRVVFGPNADIGTTGVFMKVGDGADAPTGGGAGSRTFYVTRDGRTDLIVRDSTNDIEWSTNVGTGSVTTGTTTNHALNFKTNATDRAQIAADGSVVVGSPTGGAKGAGTINAQAVYDDNTLLTPYVFDAAIDGDVDVAKFDALVPDRVSKKETLVEVPPSEALVTVPVMEKFPTGKKIKRFAIVDGGVKAVYVKEEKEVEIGTKTQVRDGYSFNEQTGKCYRHEFQPVVESRTHEPLRKFKSRLGGAEDPLNLDCYIRHWKTKRHLTSMPNEAKFDHNSALSAGEWVQRLVETVEIQAVHISQLHERIKRLEPTVGAQT